MTRRIVEVDTETTSLQPDYVTGAGVIWELAVIERHEDGTSAEHLWRMEPDLARAGPAALQVGRYYERTAGMRHRDKLPHDLAGGVKRNGGCWSDPAALAPIVARMLNGVTIVAANPTFDASFLTAYLNHYGHAATWHYRLRDIGSMAYGYLSACLALGIEGKDAALGVPSMDASTDDFARALGLEPLASDRHTALGDARLLGAMLDVITGGAQ